MKDMGYKFAFKGGLSFSRRHSRSKPQLIADARTQVEGISVNYNMSYYHNERYKQVIDVWTSANAQLTELAMKTLEKTNKVSTQCT
jgi:DNA-directed RNA polymerase subunit beta'